MANLQPDILQVIRTILLGIEDVTDVVGSRIFTHTIPERYTETDCIVLTELPSTGAHMAAPITILDVSIKCFSKTKQTARDLERTAIFPNLHAYADYVTNTFGYSFGETYRIEIYQSQSPIMRQDPDIKKEYWIVDSEYNIVLRY